jgi:hypothetical protein
VIERAWLDPALPSTIYPGDGLCLLVRGAYAGAPASEAIGLSVGGVMWPLRVWLPQRGGCRGRFWTLIDVQAVTAGCVRFDLEMRDRSGARSSLPLGEIAFRDAPTVRRRASRPARVALCLATHDPDEVLFRRQIESLRGQTLEDWIAILSDDCSTTIHQELIRDIVGGDPRFTILWGEKRVGSYANFERAVRAVPADVAGVAYCDQDDVWSAEKLETLVAALPAKGLVCSDARIVDPGGQVHSTTFWTTRTDLREDLRSILIANSVPGCTLLWDASLGRVVLPFPPQVEHLHHDGWVAAVAAAAGGIRRLSVPLVDYVQHPGNALGHFAAVNPRIGRLGRRETIYALASARVRRTIVETQIDAALRPEALARTILLRQTAGSCQPTASVAAAAAPDESSRRIGAHIGRAAIALFRGGLPGTELAVARGYVAARMSRSRARGMISG